MSQIIYTLNADNKFYMFKELSKLNNEMFRLFNIVYTDKTFNSNLTDIVQEDKIYRGIDGNDFQIIKFEFEDNETPLLIECSGPSSAYYFLNKVDVKDFWIIALEYMNAIINMNNNSNNVYDIINKTKIIDNYQKTTVMLTRNDGVTANIPTDFLKFSLLEFV